MISTGYVTTLYQRYADDLKAVRRQQYWFRWRHDNELIRWVRKLRLRRHMLFPALDDLESEITYLLIRDRRPATVVEMSPNAGWSSTWMLSALRDNRDGGQLWSYDLHDTSTKLVPNRLARGRWHFVQGDARLTIGEAPPADYLFIDSDHSAEFAAWYVGALLERLRTACLVSVHDIYHHATPSAEGDAVISWLHKRGIEHWTPAPSVNHEATRALLAERHRLGLSYVVQPRSAANSMMFFEVR